MSRPGEDGTHEDSIVSLEAALEESLLTGMEETCLIFEVTIREKGKR